ncbi:MAG: hypothetical protein HY657_03160 [Acidobacteria bacterium]|nr:hypothetical protein [Acidobacteriota bacterium]
MKTSLVILLVAVGYLIGRARAQRSRPAAPTVSVQPGHPAAILPVRGM